MFNSNSFLLGLVLGKKLDISIEKAQSIKLQMIPPNSPSVYRITILQTVGSLFSSIIDSPIQYEDILLAPITVLDQTFYVGYSKQQNILLIKESENEHRSTLSRM